MDRSVARKADKSWCFVAAVLMCLTSFTAAFGQQEEADRSDAGYIASLIDMGLDEVVAQIARNPPTREEEAEAVRNVLIDQWLVGQRGTAEAYAQAINTILAYHKRMLDLPGHEDHWARPKWATDTAQRLMLSGLASYYYASDFALVGFPDAGQRRIVDLVAEQSYDMLAAAEGEHFRLMRTLRTRNDFVFEYVNTGRLSEMQRYEQFNIPYYRAWAGTLLLTQPNDGPYFKKRGADHRKALLQSASADAQNVLQRAEAMADLLDDTRAQLHILSGHLALLRGEAGKAVELFTKAGSFEEATEYSKTIAQLGLAKAQQAAGKAAAAAAKLNALKKSEFIKSSPLHRVIVSDRFFLPKFEAAVKESDPYKKKKLIDEAFDVYVELFSSGDLGEWEGAVRPFVEERYKDQIPKGVELVDLPPVVRFAKVRALFEAGERLREEDPDAAKKQYAKASAAAAELIKTAGDSLTKNLHAEILFYKGFAELRMNQAGVAVVSFLELAEYFPDLKRGEQAANVAYVSLAKPLYQQFADNPEVTKIYERALVVLTTKYKTTETAKLATYDYAAFLREQGRYAEAIEAYGAVPENHPAYVSSRYEQLACLAAQWVEAPGSERGVLAARLNAAVRAFVELADTQLAHSQGAQRDRLRSHVASAHLIRAQMLNEAANRPDEAMRVLQKVEADYRDIEDLKPRILSQKIRVLQKQGNFAEAERLLTEFMKSQPERAGKLATAVLQAINGEIKELVNRGDQAQKIAQLAGVAVNLADKLVLPWALQQKDYTKDELMSFELMPAQSLLAAAKYKQALERYQKIKKEYGALAQKNIDVVFGLAETNFHLGTLGPASKGFNRIIKNSNEGGAPKNSTYWHAQMRVYQMLDKVAGDKKNPSIFINIRNLYRDNSSLGGDPYKTELLRLRDKHATGA